MINLPGYTIHEQLGEGGMAIVYLGHQLSLDRPVAIKILNGTLVSDPFVQGQFKQESLLVASLNHPNIIQVIDQGETSEGRPYFIMQYVKSIALTAVINREDVNLGRKLDIVIQICKALSYAHRNGVVHRDIKPANILVDYEGHVRIVDFGIAGYFSKNNNCNDTGKGDSDSQSLILGTPNYMAPEQSKPSDKITHLSDIFSLGVLMHELFIGCLPPEQTEKPEGFSRALWDIIQQCLTVNPVMRIQDADELSAKLIGLSQGRHLQSPRWENEQKIDALPGNFKLLDILKENAYGATYLVSEPKKKQWLVVKKQSVQFQGSAYSAAKALTGTDHPNIVSIYGTAENERVFITVMEYLKEGSLQDRIAQSFTIDRWILLAQQICQGLHYAHQLGIVHGNLRPSNVLVLNPGHIKVSDFGFSDHGSGNDGSRKDFDWYQPGDEEKSFSSDVFSVGAVLFHLVTGTIIHQQREGITNINVLEALSKPLAKVIGKSLEKDPKKRFQSIDEFSKALSKLAVAEKTVIVQAKTVKKEQVTNGKFSLVSKLALILLGLFFIAEALWFFGS